MQWILIGYLFLFIHRPFEFWPALGDIHLERLYMAGALLAAAVWPGKRWLPNRQHLAYRNRVYPDGAPVRAAN